MKKFIYTLLIVMGALFSSVAIAKTEAGIKTLPAGTSTAVCDTYPTCIVVSNFSSNHIYIEVPVLGVNSLLNAGWEQSIWSYDYASKQVILRDWTGYAFFNYVVANHERLEVWDWMGKAKVLTK